MMNDEPVKLWTVLRLGLQHVMLSSCSADTNKIDGTEAMANDVAAASLSNQERKRSLRSRKKNVPAVKTVLCTPYVAKWPQVDSADQQHILQQIKRFFELHCTKDVVNNTFKAAAEQKQSASETRGTDAALKTTMQQKQLIRHIVEFYSAWHAVVCGLQSVTRCLERDELRLVIVDRSSPWQLHQHLAQLSAVRQCPAMALDNVANTLCTVLAVTRLCALGFKKLDASSVFDELVHDVSSRCPSVHLPWLDVEIGLANIRQIAEQHAHQKPADSDSSRTDKFVTLSDEETSTSTAPGCKPVTDYSHLYIYKKNASSTELQRRKTAEYIALSPSSSSSDEDESSRQPVTVADVVSIDDALAASSVAAADTTPTTSICSTKYSKFYRSPNTGIQIANPNKKRKRKQF